MRIYLIGYSYGGKTTLGKQLAQRLGYSFFDTDKAIELKYRTTVPMFFNHYGEKAFRIIEKQILQTTAELDNVVVATGGGTPCNEENIRFILEHGTAIDMEMTIDEIMQRMTVARKTRPLLVNKTADEKRQYIIQQLQQRIPFYSQAPLTISAAKATPDTLIALLDHES